MAQLDSITVDAEHPASLARFWAAVLEGYAVRRYDEAELARLAALGLTPDSDPAVMVDGPGPTLCFQKMPGKASGRNRWHIDLRAASRHAEVDRLRRLGAKVREVREDWTTLLDPEGNPFCVLGERARRESGLSETIRTERLDLRPFALSDGPAIFAYSRDPDWMEYQQTTPASEREAERILAEFLLRDRKSQPTWAIERSGEVIGLVTLAFSAEHRMALLGYGIHASHRRLGLAGEAVGAVLSKAFAEYPELTRVAANTDARNHGSIRLLEKLGFAREGTLRLGGVTAKGELVDGALYGLLRSEWDARAR